MLPCEKSACCEIADAPEPSPSKYTVIERYLSTFTLLLHTNMQHLKELTHITIHYQKLILSLIVSEPLLQSNFTLKYLT